MAAKKTIDKSKKKGAKLTTASKVTKPTKRTSKSRASETSYSSDVSAGNALRGQVIKSKKVLFGLLGLLGVLVLIFLAGRYMVVAWVDNKPLTKFELYSTLDKRYGKDAAEELIVEKLLLSEASKGGVTVSNFEIEDEIKKIEEQQGGPEQLKQILEVQNISQADFEKLVKMQLIKQKLFGKDINISDEDVAKYLEENKASLPTLDPTDASAEAKLKDGVKEQLKQQKINENFNKWLTDAQGGSRVTRL